MKKLWAVLLCFVLLFAMTACGNSAPAASSGKKDAENEGIVLVLRDPDIGAGCRKTAQRPFGCQDFCTAICCKLVASERNQGGLAR